MSTQTTAALTSSLAAASIHSPPPPPPLDVIFPFSPDLTVEILALLPVKSLLQFKCVCPSWNFLISSSAFANHHLRRSSTVPTHHYHRLLAQVSSPKGNNSNNDDSSTDIYTLSHPIGSLIDDPSPSDYHSFALPRGAKIVASCNGLICCVCLHANDSSGNRIRNGHCFHYLNPSTGLRSKSPRLRHASDAFALFGFGYDSRSDSYKSVAIEKTAVRVYTLGDECWRMLPQSFPYLPLRSDHLGKDCGGRFLNGTFNWLAFRSDGTPLVVNFDFGSERFGEVSLPKEIDKNKVFTSANLWVLGGYLCFSYEIGNGEFILWQMRKYGVSDSWTVLLDISYDEVGVMYPYQFFPRPIFVLDNGEVLLRINNSGLFVLYNPRLQSFKSLKFQSDRIWFQGSTHVESLVSPCQPAAN